jgi:hypothetical protein
VSAPASTPGPWHADGEPQSGEIVVYRPAGDPLDVAFVLWDSHTDQRDRATARLIAAAPELYEALDELLPLVRKALRNGIDDPSVPGSITAPLGCAFELGQQALAKARGQ